MAQTNETLLDSLVIELENAFEAAKLIREEYRANGNDSLANIDYGATLNTSLRLAGLAFDVLDRRGLFTLGQE